MDALKGMGFEQVMVVQRYDCFRATKKERTARKYGVHGVTVAARKPG